MAGAKLAWVGCFSVLLLAGCLGGNGVSDPPYEVPVMTATWAMDGGNPQRTSRASVPGPYRGETGEGLVIRSDWSSRPPKSDEGFAVSCTSAVVDQFGGIYFCTKYAIYSLSSDGSLRWSVAYEDMPLQSGELTASFLSNAVSPVIINSELVVFALEDYSLVALDYAGNVAWRSERFGYSRLYLGGIGDQLYAAGNTRLCALDLHGGITWEYALGDSGIWECAPAVSRAGDIVLIKRDYAFDEYIVQAVNGAGQSLWSYNSGIFGEAALLNERYWPFCVYAGDKWLIPVESGIAALSEEGSELWRYSFPGYAEYGVQPHVPAIGANGLIVIPRSYGQGVARANEDLIELPTVVALNDDGSPAWHYTPAMYFTNDGVPFINSPRAFLDSNNYIYMVQASPQGVLSPLGEEIATMLYFTTEGTTTPYSELAFGLGGLLIASDNEQFSGGTSTSTRNP